jgi:glycine oxidase
LADTADVLVIGGGVFGLWAARACAAAGLRVILAEAKQVGTGASGGIVGALTPHRPTPWHDFNRFQLAALTELPSRMAALAAETGLEPGYAQPGRLSPLADAGQRLRAEAQAAAAQENWGEAGAFHVIDTPPAPLQRWLPPQACPHGLIHETLSARVPPRQYIAALRAALEGRVDLRESWRCTGLDPVAGMAHFVQGTVSAGHLIVAAGTGSPPLLDPVAGQPCGSGVKGQAALLAAETPPDLPVIQGNGIYIVAHGPDRIAVGSTSEAHWAHPGCDSHLDALIVHARALAPALSGAPVTERWAGIRPRAPGNAPMVGPLPGMERVIAATGGYKIGLGIAHLAGDAIAAMVLDHPPHHQLPPEYAPQRHFSRSPAA